MARARSESFEELKGRVLSALAAKRITGREVMEQLGISAGTLGGWVRAAQLKLEARARREGPSFVGVEVTRRELSAGVAVVEVGEDLCVRVEAGFDAGEVVRLVRALRGAAC